MGRLAALLPRSLKALSAGAALWCGSAPALANEVVRLELVLAVDCSSSVNLDEFTLQMEGIAGAFEDPRVLAALAQTGGLAVTDRKSVVSGQRVSVRVDLGGHR